MTAQATYTSIDGQDRQVTLGPDGFDIRKVEGPDRDGHPHLPTPRAPAPVEDWRGTLAYTGDPKDLPTEPPERPAFYNRRNPEPGRVYYIAEDGRMKWREN